MTTSTVPPLAGSAEIASYLGCSRQRVTQLQAADDFPQPVERLHMGRVYLFADIEHWALSTGYLSTFRDVINDLVEGALDDPDAADADTLRADYTERVLAYLGERPLTLDSAASAYDQMAIHKYI